MKGRGLAALGAALVSVAFAAAPALAASNGGHIAFASGNPTHIWTVKPNGNALRDITAGAPSGTPYCSPALSADGTRIAYVAGTRPPTDPPTDNSSWASLVVANADGTGAHPINNAYVWGPFCANAVSWSPDGHRVAYSGGGPLGGVGPMVIDVDNPVALPQDIGDGQNGYMTALWSPDGTRIATYGEDGHTHIFRLDGSVPPVVSSDYGCDLTSWSRDDGRLLEDCTGQGVLARGVWSVRAADLGDPIAVFPAAGSFATYSPDGSRIALAVDGQLDTTSADGSEAPTLVTSRSPYGISWEG